MAGLEFMLDEVVMEPASMSAAGIPAESRGAGSGPAVPRLTFRRPEPLDRSAQITGIRIKAERGERLTRNDRIAVLADYMTAEVEPLLESGKLRTAIRKLAATIFGTGVAQHELIDKLEDRVTALERERA